MIRIHRSIVVIDSFTEFLSLNIHILVFCMPKKVCGKNTFSFFSFTNSYSHSHNQTLSLQSCRRHFPFKQTALNWNSQRYSTILWSAATWSGSILLICMQSNKVRLDNKKNSTLFFCTLIYMTEKEKVGKVRAVPTVVTKQPFCFCSISITVHNRKNVLSKKIATIYCIKFFL